MNTQKLIWFLITIITFDGFSQTTTFQVGNALPGSHYTIGCNGFTTYSATAASGFSISSRTVIKNGTLTLPSNFIANSQASLSTFPNFGYLTSVTDTGSYVVSYTLASISGSAITNTSFQAVLCSANIPTPTANFSQTSTVICQGTTLNFQNSSTTSSLWNSKKFIWTIPGGSISSVTVSPNSSIGSTPSGTVNANNFQVAFNTPGIYIVSLTAYNTSGTNTLTNLGVTNTSNTKTISVTVVGNPVVSINASPSTICSGNSTTLNASGSNLTNISFSTQVVSPIFNTTYTVTGSNNSCSTTASQTVLVSVNPNPTVAVSNVTTCYGSVANFTPTGASSYNYLPTIFNFSSTSNYTITGTNTNTGCQNTVTANIIVNLLPNVIATNTSICFGNSVTLIATGANTYTWSSGNIVTPISNTTYTVTGTDANGCSNQATSTITVNSLPNINATSSSSSICLGTSATLSATGANTYTWSSGSIVSPSVTSTYTVTGTDLNGCINSALLTQVVVSCTNNTTAIQKNSTKSHIQIYPNPSTGKININYPGSGQLRITDLGGKTVFSSYFNETTELDLKLPQGYYQLQIITSYGVNNEKFVILE